MRIYLLLFEVGIDTGLTNKWYKVQSSAPKIQEQHPLGAEYPHLEIPASEAGRTRAGYGDNRAVIHLQVEYVVDVKRFAVVMKTREYLCGPRTRKESEIGRRMADLRIYLAATSNPRVA